MKNTNCLPIIVGAGPVGLGTAVFLRQAGVAVRLVDSRLEPSIYSKALAVNPRTLELLESTGVTQKMLDLGLQIRGVKFWHKGRPWAQISLSSLKHKYPFMLALSQAVTERLLTEALNNIGGSVERGTSLETCHNWPQKVEVQLRHTTGIEETVQAPWLLAADGAHSTTRQAMKVAFNGSSFEKEWYLADLYLAKPPQEDWAHVFLLDEGIAFFIRVVNDRAEESHHPLWRVVTNINNDPITQSLRADSPPVWSSSFKIAHRINERFECGHVYFAGDAAHIHSPMGARGMNLGLEDAWVFSELVKHNRMGDYGQLRKPIDQKVVARIKVLTEIVSGQSTFSRMMRLAMPKLLMKVVPLRQRLMAMLTGLDHVLKI